jgi:hypothetical protein
MKPVADDPRGASNQYRDSLQHPEFVQIKDGSNVVLLHAAAVAQIIATLRHCEALQVYPSRRPPGFFWAQQLR